MNIKSLLASSVVCFLSLLPFAANAATIVREWQPEELAKWPVGSIKNKRVKNGALAFETQAGDSQLISPMFEKFAASPWQYIELEMQSGVSGRGTFYWTGTTETKFGGFAAEKVTSFDITAGQFHTYRVEPFWQAEKQIVRLRLDFPEQQSGHYAIKALRIVEDAPPVATSLPVRDAALRDGIWRGRISWLASKGSFVCLRMAASGGSVGVISFASDVANGLHRVTFPLRADGIMHTYNVDVGADSAWRGDIIALKLEANSNAKVEFITLAAEPQGPPDLEVMFLGLHDPIARSGKPNRLEAFVRNHGGEAARDLKPRLELTGARLLGTASMPKEVEFGIPATLSWTVQADRPGEAHATLELPDAPPVTATLDFRPALNLSKAAYVPEPKPAQSDYQVGAYYYPGWHTASRWAPIKMFPERQPLLGWYREGDPEVADWQIKWAVEHGISFFLYDWYWDRGARHLEHGLEALFKARYQNLIKFCLLYANHNPQGSHSPEDFEQMTRFWIDNYFKRPNYLKVDGKPVVVIFSAMNPARDMGAEKVKPAFERMRVMCREAGLGGLYLVACTNSGTDRLSKLKEFGYDAVTAYNWPGLNMTPEESAARRASYEKNIEGYQKVWDEIAAANVLKLIPPIAGGWDARPWAGDRALVRYARTPELFKRHLLDAKQFLDTREQEPKLKMLFVEAWNELGEGSYIEPHREFGFGYLEAIREVFAPNSAKPVEYVPSDVGLGPYDIPDEPPVTAWDFSRAANPLGWSGNVANLRVEDGALRFATRGHDPALNSPRLQARADRLPFLALRIKASRDIEGQMFWSTITAPVSESSSVRFPIKGNGAFHDIRLRLADNPRWRGIITSLRFDPGSADGVDVAVESIRLEEQ
ncbi:MAG: glycoside hydrolase family 99-like domain-containing protein [Armatimonadota bacterium]|nr:glycoside hydrolase family 99-like domain-containing protein [Armatimonadota bacterium]